MSSLTLGMASRWPPSPAASWSCALCCRLPCGIAGGSAAVLAPGPRLCVACPVHPEVWDSPAPGVCVLGGGLWCRPAHTSCQTPDAGSLARGLGPHVQTFPQWLLISAPSCCLRVAPRAAFGWWLLSLSRGPVPAVWSPVSATAAVLRLASALVAQPAQVLGCAPAAQEAEAGGPELGVRLSHLAWP